MPEIVRVDVLLDDVEKGMRAMQEHGRELGRVFAALKPAARKDQRAHATSAMGPDGPWPARSAATIARMKESTRARRVRNKATRAAGGKVTRGKVRRATKTLGKLPTSIKYTASRDDLTAKSAVKWAPVQRDGGTVGRGSVLPARDFLWWSDAFIELAVTTIEDYVVAPWEKGATASSIRPGQAVPW